MNLAKRFGENLRRARKRAGYSQEELAVRASLHRTEIGLVERGERLVRIDTALKLAGAAGAPLGELLAGIEWSPGYAYRGQFETTTSGETGEEADA
jgi:transcriptional regulator with XRE-family HTH domain